jgi:hypothetical protein
MRPFIVTLAFGLMLCASAAQAERRIFIIANNADGYGIDRCLADGSPCGAAAAAAYSKTRDYAKALSYSKVDKDEITGAVPGSGTMCRGGHCEDFVAITCSR